MDDMNENPSTSSTLPPILPTQPQQGQRSTLDGVYAALRRLPARRTDEAVGGGVCATIAHQLGVAPIAIRAAAVLSTLFFGVGIGLYLIAWTVMPDASGRTHVEQALRNGRGRSLLVLAFGAIAALGVVFGSLSFLAGILPELIGIALLVAGGVWVWGRVSTRRAATERH